MDPSVGANPLEQSIINLPQLLTAYYALEPDVDVPEQRVAFGTSGHRGSSLDVKFNEGHILAISQAIAEYRLAEDITGPLFLGMDTHALSEPAHVTAIEVLAANGINVVVNQGENGQSGYTPTPVISHAILTWNRGRRSGLADGVVITPSHNPPGDGGFKYNPPSAGPADTRITRAIQDRANQLLANDLQGVRRISYKRALGLRTTVFQDMITPYVEDLGNVVDMEAIATSGIRIGVDPLGGASLSYWEPIAARYGLNLAVVNHLLDATFRFMPLDWDGKIRMDCSSRFAMANLIALKDDYDIAWGNDPDADRHGIVTPSGGLMNPNHFLSVAIEWLFTHRPDWRADAAVGKTLVSSSMIDRVAASLDRRLVEVPVGFKYFVDGLQSGSLGFGGEESAGASFLRMDGTAWSTDKDGLLLGLLAAEITAVSGKDPSMHYRALEERFGSPVYERIDSPASAAEKKALAALSPEMVKATEMAGEPILQRLTHAPGNGEPIGGLKVVTENGWFAARPSGTEDVYKIYAESFLGEAHLQRIQSDAREIVAGALQ